ncbi:MAG: transcriptional repressor NrdR [Spirochaetales bacterium]|nr:transcriptional repressor NrdR [Spirochaetales bacterium]
MRCPYCSGLDDKVIESRQNATATSIRRRRECLSCGYRFTSYERIVEKTLMVIKRDGTREAFDLTKISRGLERSLEKRPVPNEKVEELLHEIEDEAVMVGRISHEVNVEAIGEMVLKKLYILDRVAYVRFASVYRKFNNVDEFIKEIENIHKTK